ncbi:MAG: hypothetical protein OHK0017_06560 [Patescibacteria group bacterium]
MLAFVFLIGLVSLVTFLIENGRNAQASGETIQFQTTSSNSPENVPNPSLTVTMSPASSSTVTVNYAVTGGTAVNGQDFSLPTSTKITFLPGQTVASVPLRVIQNNTNNSNTTAIVTLSGPSAGAVLGSNTSHTLTIRNITNTNSFTYSPAGLENQDYNPTLPVTSNLALHLKADSGVVLDGSNQVSQWNDSSGNNNNATQSNSSQRPTVVTSKNGRSSLRFDGSNDQLEVNMSTGGSVSVFAVAENRRSSLVGSVADTVITSGVTGGSDGIVINNYNGYASTTGRVWRYAGGASASLQFYKNGDTTDLNLSQNEMSIGSFVGTGVDSKSLLRIAGYVNGGSGLNGNNDIAEILIYNTNLNTTDRLNVECYLANKYKINHSGCGIIIPNLNLNGSAGATSSTWADQSSRGLDFTQSNSSQQPLIVSGALNGKPAYRFDGSNDAMYSTIGARIAQYYTVFKSNTTNSSTYGGIIENSSSAGCCTTRMGLFESGQSYFHYNPYPPAVRKNGTSLSSPFNFSPANSAMIMTVNTNNPTLNRNMQLAGLESYYYLNVDVAEIIGFPQVLDGARQNLVEEYLSLKYGIALSGNKFQYRSSSLDKLVGIGQENGTKLSQSGSSDGLRVIENNGSLSNGEYVITATDSGFGTSSADLPSGSLSRLGKIWAIDKTGAVDAKLSFDLNQITGATPANATNYKLIYRSGTTGSFTEVAAQSTQISGTKVEFSINDAQLLDGYYTLSTTNFTSPIGQDNGEPTNLQVTAGDNQVNLTWSAPGTVTPSDYVVQYSNDGFSNNIYTFIDGVGTNPSATVTGLNFGPTYQFRILTVDNNGFVYPPSTTAQVTFQPKITSISPASGPTIGGTAVSITGSNFTISQTRRVLTVTNSSGSSATNYPINFTLDTSNLISSGKMRVDCGDIRFYESDGLTEIPYFLESGCNTATTSIWFKPTSLALGSNSFYLDYNNSSRSSNSSPTSVFTFFDDFDGASIDSSKWSIVDNTGFSVSGGQLNGTNTTGRLRSLSTYSNGYTLDAKVTINSLPSNGVQTIGYYASSSDSLGWLPHPGGTAYYRNDNSWPSVSFTPTAGSPYIYRIATKSGSLADLSIIDSTGASVASAPNVSNSVTSETIALGRRFDTDSLNNQTMSLSWDYVRAYPYLATVPTTSIGAEVSTSPAVIFGSNNGLNASTQSPTSLTVTSPAGLAGAVNLKVTNPGNIDSNSVTFTYQAPQVTNLSVTSGPVAGGQEVVINGANFDTSSTYKRSVTVINSNTTSVNDYENSISLNTSNLIANGKMRSDCGDVRVKDTDGNTDLPYWIENCASTSTKIWFKKSVLTPGSNTIYLTYGNLSLTSQSNGSNVFTFFDDFNGSSLDSTKWDITNSSQGTITVSGGKLNLISSGDWWSTADTSLYITNKSAISGNYIAETFITDGFNNCYDRVIGLRKSAATNSANMHIYRCNQLYGAYRDTDGGFASSSAGSVTYNGLNKIVGLTKIGDTSTTFYDNQTVLSRTISNWDLKYVALSDTFHSNGNIGNTFDWVRVRKYIEGIDLVLNSEQRIYQVNVNFGSNAATNVVVNSSSQLTAVTPAGTTGSVSVQVSNSQDNSSGTLANAYTYVLPTISSVSPAQGPTSGNTYIRITGTNFSTGGAQKRSVLRINNATGNTITNYEGSFVLNTSSLISSGSMRSDCGDLRLVDSDGTTSLDYLIDGACNTTNTVIWVKIPSLAVGYKNIYVTYGNNALTTTSNLNAFSFASILNSSNNIAWMKSSGYSGYTIDGASVSSIPNSNGSGNFVQTTTDRRPTYLNSGINGRPSLNFDGANDSLLLSSVSTTQSGGYSGFGVVDLTQITTNQSLYNSPRASGQGFTFLASSNSGQVTYIGGGTNSFGAAQTGSQLLTWKQENSSSSNQAFRNGNLIGSTGFENRPINTSFYIGSEQENSNWFQGKIGEVILFNTPLNNSSKQIVENYLMTKYQLNTSANPAIEVGNSQSYNLTVDGRPVFNTTIQSNNNVITGYVSSSTSGIKDIVYTDGSGNSITLAGSFNYGLAAQPNPITNLSVLEEKDSRITLTWTAPDSNGNAITDYIIKYSTNNFVTENTFNDGVNAAPGATITGLTVGQQYWFKVLAVNASGTSFDSNLANVSSLDCDNNLNGQDLIISSATTLSGRYCNVGLFKVNSGVTATLDSNLKAVKIYANNVIVDGIINGQGKGYAGGTTNGCDGTSGLGIGGALSNLATSYNHGAGAGYGGVGGAGSFGTPGIEYGSVTEPSGIGSGGGSSRGGCGGAGNGGAGGTALKIFSNNSFSVAGTINLNGDNGIDSSYDGGGGSGGSVWLNAGTFTGAGTVSANGGNGNSAGGGGGGRVAIYYNTSTFSGTVSSYGGPGGNLGGAGTVYQKLAADSFGSITIDNNNGAGSVTGRTNFSTYFDGAGIKTLNIRNKSNVNISNSYNIAGDVNITSNSLISHTQNTSTQLYKIDLTVNGNMSIDSTSSINASGLGFQGGQTNSQAGFGTGGGGSACRSGGGAYGGTGGNTAYDLNGSLTMYGSTTQPTDLGSGSGFASCGTVGANGGGAIKLVVNGTLTVNGSIKADGAPGSSSYIGGGSGGSVWVDANTLVGNGTISANGGASGYQGGSGGGGRLAYYYQTKTFTGSTTAYPGAGNGGGIGGAGTVYEKAASSSNGNLSIVSNVAGTYTHTTIDSTNLSVDAVQNLTISSNTTVYLDKALTIPGTLDVSGATYIGATTPFGNIGTLNVNNGALLSTRNNTTIKQYVVDLNTNILNVNTGGAINVDGRGFQGGQTNNQAGFGTGGGSFACRSGGGAFGGAGGNSTYGDLGGSSIYGSITQPTDLGSGSGYSGCGGVGASGGGAIKLNVNGTLTNNGSISANGTNAPSSYIGGGSGGSLWVIANTIAGNGTFSANGGAGGYQAGGGGGGRIAMYYQTKTISGTVSAYGGAGNNGSVGGGSGSIFDKSNSATNGDLSFVTNLTAQAAVSSIDSSNFSLSAIDNLIVSQYSSLNLDKSISIANNFNINGITTFRNTASFGAINNMTVSSTGYITSQNNTTAKVYTIDLNVSNLTINTGGAINVDGKGFRGGQTTSENGYGPGASNYGSPSSGGAAYGGVGGNGSGGPGSTNTYGSISQPTDLGSGSGYAYSGGAGSNGGGAIKLTVTGTLNNSGSISANGVLGSTNYIGGSSGGSVWLTAGTFAGNGSISANGGAGGFQAGGAGGGRIALYYQTRTYSGTTTVTGGAAGSNGGQAGAVGTIYDPNTPEVGITSATVSTVPSPVSVGSTYQLSITNIKNTFASSLYSGTCSVTVTGPSSYSQTRTGTISQGTCTLTGSAFPDPVNTGTYTAAVTVTATGTESRSINFTVFSAPSNKAKEDSVAGRPVISSIVATPANGLIGATISITASGFVDSGNNQSLNGIPCTLNISGPSSYNATFVTSNLVGGICTYNFNATELPNTAGPYTVSVSVAGNSATLTSATTNFNRYFDIYLEAPGSPNSFNYTGKIPGTLTSSANPIVAGGPSPTITSPAIKKYDNSTLIAQGTVCKNRVQVDSYTPVDYSSTINSSGQCITTIPNSNITAGTFKIKTIVTLTVNSNNFDFETSETTISTAGFPSNRAKAQASPNQIRPVYTAQTVNSTTTFVGSTVTITVSGLLDSANNQPLANSTCNFNVSGPGGFASNYSVTASSGNCVLNLSANDIPKRAGQFTYNLNLVGDSGTLNTPSDTFNKLFNLYLIGGTNGVSGTIPGSITSNPSPVFVNQNAVIYSPYIRAYDNSAYISNGITCKNIVSINSGTPIELTGTISSGLCSTTLPAASITASGTMSVKTVLSLFNSDYNSDYTFETASTILTIRYAPTAKICANTFRDDNSNGVKDGSEPVLAGVLTRLRDGNSVLLNSFYTSSNALSNCFNNLYDDNYYIEQVTPSGSTKTVPVSGSSYFVNLGVGVTETRDFGYNGNAVICPNPTFFDVNENGSFDGSDTRISNLSTRLYLATDTNNALQTIQTNSSGTNCFAAVVPDNYIIKQDVPSENTVSTTSATIAGGVSTKSLTLNFGTNQNVSFGYRLLPSGKAKLKTGSTTEPANTGTVVNSGNPVYVNYNFSAVTNGLVDSGSNQPLTGVTCSMTFSGAGFPTPLTKNGTVTNGTCLVDPVPTDTGTTYVTTTVTGDNGSLTTSQTTFEVLSGNVTICSIPYRDDNKNGTRDGSEPILSGVESKLYKDAGATLLQTITSTGVLAGNCFADVAPGIQYQVTQTSPTGGVSTTGGLTQTFTPNPDVDENRYFGYKGNATICPNPTFRDDNRDGAKNGSEVNLNGYSTSLRDANNITLQTITIDNTSCFTEILPGVYSVVQTKPNLNISVTTGGTVSGSSVTNSVSVSSAQTSSTSFGYASDATICPNPTFKDYNLDGQRSGNEPLIGNLTTKLVRISDNQEVASITTNGSNCFTQVIPDSYNVVQTGPTGGISTTGGSTRAVTLNFGVSETLSFGYKGQATICPNPTFQDDNSNGTQDAGEVLINGVNTLLKDSDGNTVGSLNTGASSCFNDLLPGDYRLIQTTPSGATSTTGGNDKVINNLTTTETRSISFGYNGNPSICPVVYRDDNNNSIRDNGEVLINGVVVTLKDSTGTNTISSFTSNGTSQCFGPLPITSYKVVASNLNGYTASNASTQDITLTFGVGQNPLFGYYGSGTICIDKTYIDGNADGNYSSGETLLSGINSYLRVSNSTSNLQTKTTNVNGQTCFDSVPPGQYVVLQDAPSGSTSTTGGNQNITLTPGETRNLNFGYAGAGTICANVFNDVNFDGTKISSEGYISGTTVKLFKTNDLNNAIDTKSSNSTGATCFSNLFPDNYTVKVESVPAGYTSTTGGDTQNYTLGAAGYQNLYYGYTNNPSYALSLIRGFMFVDRNENNLYEPYGGDTAEVTVFDNDIPVTNQEIKLSKLNTTTSQYEYQNSYITGIDGKYEFLDLQPGTYKLEVPIQVGLSAVNPSPAERIITITSNEKYPNRDFTFQYTAKICPKVYVDKNNNNVYEPNGADGNSNTLSDNDIDLLATNGAYYQLTYASFNGNQVSSNGNQFGYLINSQNPCITKVPPRDYTLSFRSDLIGPNNLNYIDTYNTAFYTQISSNPQITIYLGTELETNQRFFTNQTVNLSPSTISGRVWNDQPTYGGDGSFDADGDDNKSGQENVGGTDYDRNYDNDKPYEGVNLALKKCGVGFDETQTDIDNWNANMPTTSSDVSGNYTFSNIPPGAYAVIRTSALPNETALEDIRYNDCSYWYNNYVFFNNTFTQSGGNTPGTTVSNYDIIARNKNDLRYIIYVDQNHNNQFDAWETNGTNENYIYGTLRIKTTANVVQKTLSSILGKIVYSVGPGDYKADFVNYTSPYPAISQNELDKSFTVSNADSQSIVTFGFNPTNNSSLTGKVFVDRNGNLNYQADGADLNSSTTFDNDQVLSGKTVELYYGTTSGGYSPSQYVTSTTTDSNGNYTFSNLAEGYYSVRITSSLTPGTSCARCDFGYNVYQGRVDMVYVAKDSTETQNLTYNYSGKLNLKAFYDTIANGVRDSAEVDGQNMTFTVTYSDGYVVGTVGPTPNIQNNARSFINLPAGNYTVTVNNIPSNISLTAGYSSPDNISLLSGEDYTRDYPFTPGTNTIQGYVFVDRGRPNTSGVNNYGNFDNVLQTSGPDSNASATFDNEQPLANANVKVSGPLGQYTASTDSNGFYQITVPSGNYKLHTFRDDDTSQVDPIPNVTNLGSINSDVVDRCIGALRCRSYVNGRWTWISYSYQVDDVTAIKNGIDIHNSETINNNIGYVYTNTIKTRCVDDRNGDGQITTYPDLNYTESEITGCSFEIVTPTGEVLSYTANASVSQFHLPPGSYQIRKLNNVTGKVNTNAQRYMPPTTNYGPLDNVSFNFNTANVYQDAFFNYFQYLQPATNNASVTGRVFLDRAQDQFFQQFGVDGIATSLEDNDVPLYENLILTLTGNSGSGQTVNRTASPNSDGIYQFTDLPSGTYSISPNIQSQAGFKQVWINGVNPVNSGADYQINYSTYNFSPGNGNFKVGFYYNTEARNVNNKLTTSNSPYQTSLSGKPAGANQICAVVVNPDNTVIANSGNCIALP